MRSHFVAAAVAAQVAAVVATPVVPAAVARADNGIATPTPIQDGMVDNCNSFYLVSSGDTCQVIADKQGVATSDLIAWNPAVGSDCTNLWLGYELCVGVVGGASATVTATATSTGSGNGITTPTPTQAGMVSNCNTFYQVSSGDTCQSIADSKGVSVSDLVSWNPAVGSDCTSLWLGYQVCVNVIGGTTATPTATSTPTKPDNGVTTPTPTQAGMVDSCKTFHLVVSGDSCDQIAKVDAGVSLDTFYSWNPAVGNTCANLWLGYYVCIAVL
ncbi:hypothetical protein GQ53DRAFT_652557 [Thozetella sp. PMI_491]|nr:hypothetical protein GQ53DRAFT_652557 [Thozetella sp. PMI_491]